MMVKMIWSRSFVQTQFGKLENYYSGRRGGGIVYGIQACPEQWSRPKYTLYSGEARAWNAGDKKALTKIGQWANLDLAKQAAQADAEARAP